jgi:hypothetical protein
MIILILRKDANYHALIFSDNTTIQHVSFEKKTTLTSYYDDILASILLSSISSESKINKIPPSELNDFSGFQVVEIIMLQ